jgi:hypothetical protein
MAKKPVTLPSFNGVDQVAREIVGDIFTANGISMTKEEADPLLDALAAAVARRVAAMQAGAKRPTDKQKIDAAERLRGYGCFMAPSHPDPEAIDVFLKEGRKWGDAADRTYVPTRPFPGQAAVQVIMSRMFALQEAGEMPPPRTARSEKIDPS